MFNSNEMPFTMPVQPAYNGNCGNGGMGGWADGGWLWFIIVIFALFGGWGNGGFGNNGGGQALTRGELCQDMNFADVAAGIRGIQSSQDAGFRTIDNAVCVLGNQAATLANGIQMQVAGGFANLDTELCQVTNNLTNSINGVSAQLAQCCCDNRQAIAETNYNLATQAGTLGRDIERGFANTNFAMAQNNCATLQAIDKVGDRVIDYLANQEAQKLRDENFALKLSASQQEQNNYLVNQLRPCPIPSYQTCNPWASSYNYGYNGCCGCNG